MKKSIKWLWLLAAAVLLTAGGCATRAEYYEELTEEEHKELLNNARSLALRGKAVPPHLHGVFKEIAPHERIVYTGNKRGKASFRWEIYENVSGKRITQEDINPYWIMVYATGNLRDPKWKLTFANKYTAKDMPDPDEVTQVRQNYRNNPRVRYKR